MTDAWAELRVRVPAELSDAVGCFLTDRGASGLVSDESGESVELTAYFSGNAPVAELEVYARELAELFPNLPALRLERGQVSDESWAESWKEHFSPLPIGEALFVHPPWCTKIPAGRLAIRLNPGMAFGTGHHASTRGCLVLLERALKENLPERILDLGCGSGILAIAAAKLGDSPIDAVDVDPDAMRITLENAAVNGVDRCIRPRSSLADARGPYGLILANILAGTLVELVSEIRDRLIVGGRAIGSGLRLEEEAEVVSVWAEHGLRPEDRYEEDGWVTLRFRRAA